MLELLDESWINLKGLKIYELASELWPLNRSLTGDGNRRTLAILKREIPSLQVHEVPTGTKAFDWTVPKEWVIREAWIRTPAGKKICDFSQNNLHIVGYSEPVHEFLSLESLQERLYTQPDQPDAIPYVTSYYSSRWGFCLSEEERSTLEEGEYEVFIDSELIDGFLSYGEVIIPGEQESEIFLSTYICHPSMANNELSGIAVATGLIQWLSSLQHRKHTYRIVFVPETIGPLVYLSRHLRQMKDNVIAGYVLTCVGDDRAYSYVPSRNGATLADSVAVSVLAAIDPEFRRYSWVDRQSDERQYCAPHVDLPVASIMRSKYGSYDEYHTSLDRLGEVVTAAGLSGSLRAYARAIQALELDYRPTATTIGEPQLGKRGLYPEVSQKGSYEKIRIMREVLSWADGDHSILEIAEKTNSDFREVFEVAMLLEEHFLLAR
jgi:aminopeptidase-like protein